MAYASLSFYVWVYYYKTELIDFKCTMFLYELFINLNCTLMSSC